MKRRDFVSLVSAAMGTSVVLSCKKSMTDTEASSHLDMMSARGGGGGAVIRYPLKFPTVVSPSGLTLDSKLATSDLGGGLVSNVWAYNGQFPGPTIKANRGDQVSIQLQNHLPEQTITHWHGMIVDHENDGQPMHVIDPASVYIN